MAVESILFFETPEQIYARVFRELKPRTPLPAITVEFCAFANANSQIRLENSRLHVRITDILESAPAPILEALAMILLSKLYRRPVPRHFAHRYRLYMNRRDVRHHLQRLRQERGRKYVSGGRGDTYDLEEIFEAINLRYFHGLMARPELGWSRRPSRTMLGHYDPSHHVIILSKLLDRPEVPHLAVEYVMFHEMLHLRHPVEHHGARRCVHTPAFRAAEKEFEHLAEAKAMLKRL
jgi:hypothetical protein